MKFKISLFFIAAIATTVGGCVDIPDFSDTPNIIYNSIDQHTEIDSSTGVPQQTEIVTLTVDFEDGDGDLGASSAQLQDPNFTSAYSQIPGWNKPANYELVTMTKKSDGSFAETVLQGDSFKFFPDLKPDGKPGPIKGKLDLNIRFLSSRSAVPTTQKYKVRIMDRAYHISNQTEPSDEVIVPVLP